MCVQQSLFTLTYSGSACHAGKKDRILTIFFVRLPVFRSIPCVSAFDNESRNGVNSGEAG